MKLNPGERSILAGFFQRNEVQRAEEELRQAGFETVQVDRISEYGFSPGADEARPVMAGGAARQTSQILFGRQSAPGDDVRILMSATSAVSGMAGEVRQEAPYLMTVVTSEERVEEALKIIRQNRGNA